MIEFGKTKLVEGVAPEVMCTHCAEPFNDTGGVIVPAIQGPPAPFHRECMARLMFGGYFHQLRRCTCCGGDEPADPPSLTTREAARVAAMHVQRQARRNGGMGPWFMEEGDGRK